MTVKRKAFPSLPLCAGTVFGLYDMQFVNGTLSLLNYHSLPGKLPIAIARRNANSVASTKISSTLLVIRYKFKFRSPDFEFSRR
jgi:hypothetical protein